MIKFTKTSILPNCKVPNSFFWYNLQFCYPSHSFVKEDTLILLLSGWDRSRDSTANRNLSKDMYRTLVCRIFGITAARVPTTYISYVSHFSTSCPLIHYTKQNLIFSKVKIWLLLNIFAFKKNNLITKELEIESEILPMFARNRQLNPQQ